MYWDKLGDCLQLKPPELKDPPYSKRNLLSNLAKFWDPLGMVAPVTIAIKIKLQSLWDDQLEWDDSIADEEHKIWKKLFEEAWKQLLK